MAQPKETRQWVTKQDGIKNLEQETASLPKLADGEVLVKILAVSLNYRDIEGMTILLSHPHSNASSNKQFIPC
jgi:NADPH:quinone reductase-like Zn-dependent oxidoreductase